MPGTGKEKIMLEESFECLSKEQCGAYLKKLELEKPGSCDLEFLDRLILRHLERISFENLDVVWKHNLINTALDAVYKKVVENGRGGYCFELNALFLGLLRGLGYDAYPVACRVMVPGENTVRIPTHRGSVVRLDGKKYFCDVGFGGIACTRAARMDPGTVTETKFGSFFFEQDYEGWLMMRYVSKQTIPPQKPGIILSEDPCRMQAEPADILMVSEYACSPVDFAYANRAMCEKGSHFYDRLTVQRMTEYGPCSIEYNHVTLRDENGKKEFDVSSEEELNRILKEKFMLKV